MNVRFFMGLAMRGIWLVVMLTGCAEPAADVAHPLQYSKQGIVFSYPGNWEITDDTLTGDVRQVYVDSPGNAICIVHIQPADSVMTVIEFARFFSKTFKEQVPVGKVLRVDFGAVAPDALGEKLTEKFTLQLAGVDMPHTRIYQRIVTGKSSGTLIYQVADEDAAAVQKGFALITSSFKLNGTSSATPKSK